MVRRLLLPVVSLLCLGLTCGWGVPLESLASHCPPRTVDCGPGCIEEGTTCCDDALGGGLSQCPTAGMGQGKACVARGTGSCAANGPGRFCCGEPTLAGDLPSQDITQTFSGDLGVFCGTSVIEAGEECCSSVEGKRICRRTSTRLYASGAGGGTGGFSGGGGTGAGPATGGGGGTTPSCSTSGPGFNGSARWCGQLSALCNCSSDSTNRCITKAEFDKAGKTYPGQCKPQGSSGCFDTASQFVIAPCCAGLTCKVSSVCGAQSAGGTCLP